ncbi:MAG TPA: hypothetical protein VN426_09515 [Syntrophomonadaceae bacterium]|nr:hypothetical protein [Syntrophomonadaceae bacterium]
MKVLKYMVIYMLVLQLTLPYTVPLHSAYLYRMNYNLVKDNLDDIDVILDKISQQIEKEQLQDYIIILGDSVAFSGPGSSNTSLGYYLENLAKHSNLRTPLRVFNLAMPGMQTGDVYTMLLKLDQHKISTDHVIFNLIYAGFVERDPSPSVVFWLKDDLHDLDIDSFNRVLPNLTANNYHYQQGLPILFNKMVQKNVALFAYRDLIYKYCSDVYYDVRFGRVPDDSLGDAGPWFNKSYLSELLQEPEYQRDWSTKPFDMSSNNPQIYFLNKIIKHQDGKNTLVFLAAVNEKLLGDIVPLADYSNNVAQIDNYFRNKPVKYVNMQGKIDQALFSDWVHLTGAGYQELSKILWDNYDMGAQGQ